MFHAESKEKSIIDATFGEGGHTRALLATGARVLAIDRDITQVQRSTFHVPDGQLILKQGNFKDIEEIARSFDLVPVCRQAGASGGKIET